MRSLLKYSAALLLLIAAVAFALKLRAPAESVRNETDLAEQLLAAVAHDDYAAFVALGDPRLRHLARDDFRALAGQSADRLRGGHALQPIDEHWRGNFHVRRWKVTFTGGGPDATLTLAFRDGRLSTFALH
jgi:hypothetical protein